MEAKLQSDESNKRLLENLNSQEQHCKLLKEGNQSFAEELNAFENHLSIVHGKFHSIRAENLEVGFSILNWFNIHLLLAFLFPKNTLLANVVCTDVKKLQSGLENCVTNAEMVEKDAKDCNLLIQSVLKDKQDSMVELERTRSEIETLTQTLNQAKSERLEVSSLFLFHIVVRFSLIFVTNYFYNFSWKACLMRWLVRRKNLKLNKKFTQGNIYIPKPFARSSMAIIWN